MLLHIVPDRIGRIPFPCASGLQEVPHEAGAEGRPHHVDRAPLEAACTFRVWTASHEFSVLEIRELENLRVHIHVINMYNYIYIYIYIQ